MLKNDFYEIIEFQISEIKDNIKASIKLNPEHNIFKGHFPDMPIVPGVCMLQIMKEILNEFLKKDYSLISGKNIKYHNLVNPKINPILHYDLQISYIGDNVLSINSRIYYEKSTFCQFKGEFSNLNN